MGYANGVCLVQVFRNPEFGSGFFPLFIGDGNRWVFLEIFEHLNISRGSIAKILFLVPLFVYTRTDGNKFFDEFEFLEGRDGAII